MYSPPSRMRVSYKAHAIEHQSAIALEISSSQRRASATHLEPHEIGRRAKDLGERLAHITLRR